MGYKPTHSKFKEIKTSIQVLQQEILDLERMETNPLLEGERENVAKIELSEKIENAADDLAFMEGKVEGLELEIGIQERLNKS